MNQAHLLTYIIHRQAQLAEAMETAISADFRIAKPSELIKMVGEEEYKWMSLLMMA